MNLIVTVKFDWLHASYLVVLIQQDYVVFSCSIVILSGNENNKGGINCAILIKIMNASVARNVCKKWKIHTWNLKQLIYTRTNDVPRGAVGQLASRFENELHWTCLVTYQYRENWSLSNHYLLKQLQESRVSLSLYLHILYLNSRMIWFIISRFNKENYLTFSDFLDWFYYR